MTDDIAALFAYNRWADDRLLEACRAVPAGRYAAEVVPGWASLHATVAHLAGATEVWSRRFQGESAPPMLGEAELPTLDAAARLLAHAHDALDRLAGGLTADRLAAPLTYRNSRGVTATLPLWAALRHVVNHATYHRGQAASKLKRLGVEPPVTDLSAWAAGLTPQAPAEAPR